MYIFSNTCSVYSNWRARFGRTRERFLQIHELAVPKSISDSRLISMAVQKRIIVRFVAGSNFMRKFRTTWIWTHLRACAHYTVRWLNARTPCYGESLARNRAHFHLILFQFNLTCIINFWIYMNEFK